MLKSIPLRDIRITDAFFSSRIETARRTAIPYMWNALNDAIPGVASSGCIANFRIAAGLQEGEFTGYWFQDSDLWKWIEGAAYSLATHPDPELEAWIDGAIDLAAQAQQPDGYLDTYYIIKGIDKRFTNLRDNHELYVAGHMCEAAAAYFEATGKRKLLDMACRFADCIDRYLGSGEGKLRGYPGHQEIELGLVKLYRITGEERYLALAKYFLDERGQQPHYFDQESARRGEEERPSGRRYMPPKYAYWQAHLPVREQFEGTGHAVRQCYMLASMADVGMLSGDDTLLAAADRVFDDIVNRQMYITGGVGATHEGEAFTFDYDLPPERCYTETCASIAMAMTALRLSRAHPDARYGEVVERELYNGILSGVSLDGTKYFYMNPLEVWPERCERRQDLFIDPQRLGWFGCACCPPNILRTLCGLGGYLYSADEDRLCVEQYVSSEVRWNGLRLELQSGFPWHGTVRLALDMDGSKRFALWLRIPMWAKTFALKLNGRACEVDVRHGYAVLEREFQMGDVLELDFPMEARFMKASSHSPNYVGKAALTRGPLVYCAEQIDNGAELWNLVVKPETVRAEYCDGLLNGVMRLFCAGRREYVEGGLYVSDAARYVPAELTFVPYYAWGNRGKGEMSVWMRHE